MIAGYRPGFSLAGSAPVVPVENPGEKLGPQLVATPVEPFQRGTKRMQVSDSAWQSSNALPELTTEPSPLPHGPLAGSAARWSYPPRRRPLADDDEGLAKHWSRRVPGVSATSELSLLAARSYLDPADDVSVGIHHVGLASSVTDGLRRPGADPPTRKIVDELIEVADSDGHYGLSSPLGILDHVKPTATSYTPHGLVLIGNDVSDTSEKLFVPTDRFLEVHYRDTGKENLRGHPTSLPLSDGICPPLSLK